MGHDLSLAIKQIKNPHYNDETKLWESEMIWEDLDCFPVIGEGTYACDLIEDKLVPKTLQNRLYITYNLSKIWYLAMENIGHPVESTGAWLNNSKSKDILPILEKLFDEIISKPEIYKALEPKPYNKVGEVWGSYKSFCDKIYALIFACRKYPEATILDWY